MKIKSFVIKKNQQKSYVKFHIEQTDYNVLTNISTHLCNVIRDNQWSITDEIELLDLSVDFNKIILKYLLEKKHFYFKK